MRHRKGFILTNGTGCYIAQAEQKDEIAELLAAGWRVAVIRPICTSMAVKLNYLPPSVLDQKIYSYSLCVLESRGSEEKNDFKS